MPGDAGQCGITEVRCGLGMCPAAGYGEHATRTCPSASKQLRVVSWVRSSRSVASAWRRRSTASCCARRVSSVGTRSSLPDPRGWRRLTAAAEFARRRLAGDFEVDEYGFDPDLNSALLMPAALALYRNWFRVQARGLANIPDTGSALIVANHSGVLPLDAIMLQVGIFADHPAKRNLRLLGADLVYTMPVLSSLARRSGHTRADPGQAHRMLVGGEIVGVFPEGFKGIGKPFSERYRLQRFGRGGFARAALRAGVPIIPCAIVGAEEIYPMLGNSAALADALGLPYFPLTPLFPWLGPLGAVPLPSKWIIEFCEPIAACDEPIAEPDEDLVARLADAVRDTIQLKLDDLVAARGPAFG
jgi:1-acyl-sn-glycerol-3-phosphate acyltransferase